MTKQTFVRSEYKTITCDSLKITELAEVISGDYIGIVITRYFGGFICLYSPHTKAMAFRSTWSSDPSFMLRVLSEDESITLSN